MRHINRTTRIYNGMDPEAPSLEEIEAEEATYWDAVDRAIDDYLMGDDL